MSLARGEVYGFLAIWIALFHVSQYGYDFTQISPVLEPLQWVIEHGNLGVDAFMLLSGISLYYSFEKDPNAARFFARRLERILPAVFLTCGVYWVACVLAGTWDSKYLIYKLFMISDLITGSDDGFWFVSTIVVFYFVYPYIHSFIYAGYEEGNDDTAVTVRTLFLVVISLVFYWMVHRYVSSWFGLSSTALARLPIFIVGCWMGHCVKENRDMPRYVWGLLVVLLVSWVLFTLFKIDRATPWWWRIPFSIGALPVTFLLSRLLCAFGGGRVSRTLGFVGNMSLEVYVTQVSLNKGLGILPKISASLPYAIFMNALAFVWAYVARLLEPKLLALLKRAAVACKLIPAPVSAPQSSLASSPGPVASAPIQPGSRPYEADEKTGASNAS